MNLNEHALEIFAKARCSAQRKEKVTRTLKWTLRVGKFVPLPFDGGPGYPTPPGPEDGNISERIFAFALSVWPADALLALPAHVKPARIYYNVKDVIVALFPDAQSLLPEIKELTELATK